MFNETLGLYQEAQFDTSLPYILLSEEVGKFVFRIITSRVPSCQIVDEKTIKCIVCDNKSDVDNIPDIILHLHPEI